MLVQNMQRSPTVASWGRKERERGYAGLGQGQVTPRAHATRYLPIPSVGLLILFDYAENTAGNVSYTFSDWPKDSVKYSDVQQSRSAHSESKYSTQYSDRINELRNVAEEEDFQFNEASLETFLNILGDAGSEVRLASLMVDSEEGHVEAIWSSNDSKTRLSVEFHDEDRIKLTMVSLDGQFDREYVSRDEFWRKINDRNLGYLLLEERR